MSVLKRMFLFVLIIKNLRNKLQILIFQVKITSKGTYCINMSIQVELILNF